MNKDMYLVTGGAGFIGSHIVKFILEKGADVRVLDNFSTGRRENLEGLISDIELIEGDVRDREIVARAVSGCAYVLHQAALPSVVRSIEDPVTVHDINVTGTVNLLLAARDAGARRFVFASSSSVYGRNPSLPKREDACTCPMSPYAVSKLAGEQYCAVFSQLYGLPCVSLRYFNVFGPKQDPSSQYAAVIPNFFTALIGGSEPMVHGDGEQTRDFTFVRNVAEANWRACAAPIEGAEVCNIAYGESTSINDLLRFVQEACGVHTPPSYGPARPGDVRHSRADISEAEKKLGYTPSIGLKEGLVIVEKYYREQLERGKP